MRFLQPHCCFSPAAITAPRTGGWSKTRRPWRPTSPVTAHGWARKRPRCRPSGCGAGSSKRCARPTPSRSGVSASGSAGSKPPPRPSPSPTPKSAPRCATPSSSGYTTRSPYATPSGCSAGATRGFRSKDASAATRPPAASAASTPCASTLVLLDTACRIRSVDTLRQAVHRIPRRFLFIRWGTKALRQEIVSTNPHTRIVYAEYVKIER